MQKLNINASWVRTIGVFNNKVNNKSQKYLPLKIKYFSNNMEMFKSQDYVVNVREENSYSVNCCSAQRNGKSLTLKGVCIGMLVVQTVSLVAAASPAERTSESTQLRNKRGFSFFTDTNDCTPYATQRANVQLLDDCSNDIAYLNRQAKHLIHHTRIRGKIECSHMNTEIEEVGFITGKPVSTGVSPECFGANVSNDIVNLKREQTDNEYYIEVLSKQDSAYAAISVKILNMHGDNVAGDIEKLAQQRDKIWEIHDVMNDIPDDCKIFIKNQYSTNNTRGAFENLEGLVAGFEDTKFEIYREIIFANDKIPKKGGIGCEVSAIAPKKMDTYHDEKYFRCDNGGPKDKYCDDPATQQADVIYKNNFSKSRVRSGMHYKKR